MFKMDCDGNCPSCKMDALTDELQFRSIELKMQLLKAKYKLDTALAYVELARLAGTELDFSIAMVAKAKADAKYFKVVAEVIEFHEDAEAKYRSGLKGFLESYFDAIGLEIDLDAGMPRFVVAA